MAPRRLPATTAAPAGRAGRRAALAGFVLIGALVAVAPARAAAVAAEPAATATPAAAPAQTFAVTISDGRFQPERIDVPAGIKLRLELTNLGPGPLEFENSEMHVEKVLAAGARSVVVLPPLAPGEYSFIDEFNPITGELKLIAK